MTIDQAKLYMCEDRIDFQSCLGARMLQLGCAWALRVVWVLCPLQAAVQHVLDQEKKGGGLN